MEREILVIDIETTGFMNQGGAIVEVGIVSLDLDSGGVKIVFSSVCREEILTGRHRTEPMGWIFRNSDLTVEEVRQAPLLTNLLPKIQKIINEYPAGATAYNRDFDFEFLEGRGVVFPIKLPCPMLLATDLCKIPLPRSHPSPGPYKWPKVEEAWSCLFPNEPYIEKHRGPDDALHEARIVHELYHLGLYCLT